MPDALCPLCFKAHAPSVVCYPVGPGVMSDSAESSTAAPDLTRDLDDMADGMGTYPTMWCDATKRESALVREAAAEVRRLRSLVYAYPPTEPFAGDGQTWKQLSDLQWAETRRLREEADELRDEVNDLQCLNTAQFSRLQAYCRAADEDRAEIERLQAEIAELKRPKTVQRQDSTADQMHDLHRLAIHEGMYDAADWLKRMWIQRFGDANA